MKEVLITTLIVSIAAGIAIPVAAQQLQEDGVPAIEGDSSSTELTELEPFVATQEIIEDDASDQSPLCKADYNQDGTINALDFAQFGQNYKQPAIDCLLDLTDDDCELTVTDFSAFGQVYNQASNCSEKEGGGGGTGGGGGDQPPGEGEFTQVDPDSQTDNEINEFLLNLVETEGTGKIIAGGAWWGPTNKFFENQIWIVNKTFVNGNIYSPNTTIPQDIACVLPGEGTSRNTLVNPYLINPIRSERATPLGKFQTLNWKAPGDGQDYELRSICTADEGIDNNFGDGTAIEGERIQVNINQTIWGNRKTNYYHHVGDVHFDAVDLHAWYTDVDYVYIALDGACNDGPCTNDELNSNLSTSELIGATVSGELTLYAHLLKLKHVQNIPFHHMELRIEQDGEDYTVERAYSPSSEGGIDTRGRQSLSLDTTKIDDGWHIISWHAHVIDKNTSGPKNGKQLAGEIKFPICVDNTNSGACD